MVVLGGLWGIFGEGLGRSWVPLGLPCPPAPGSGQVAAPTLFAPNFDLTNVRVCARGPAKAASSHGPASSKTMHGPHYASAGGALPLLDHLALVLWMTEHGPQSLELKPKLSEAKAPWSYITIQSPESGG